MTLTDLEHWGVAERWSYPDDGYGDCEDYVLLKRRMLISSGWPREALLVTLVRDQRNEGHAVLTVTTDRGDYVLDNQNDNILLWSKTGYRFFKRQSQSNAAQWVSLNDSRPAIAKKTPSSASPSDLLAANSALTTIPGRARSRTTIRSAAGNSIPRDSIDRRKHRRGAVAGLVGIEGGVVSEVMNLESSGVRAPDRRPRHDE